MAQVSLKNVSKEFSGNVWAIKDINLGIENKEFVVFVGPSGCGKSTTLRIIAGLEEATHGDVYIGNQLVNDIPPKDRNIAMVFQNYALYPHMTVYENMAFGLKLRKYPKAEIETRVKETAVILGIENLLHRKPRELSGGQRQRVAVGRAIVRKPLVFLFDEPLSNLDAKMRVVMRTEIKKLHMRLQTTMIYVTHDQTEAMTLGDRVVVLRAGEAQQIGTPAELYNTPANLFVAGFIGSPAMNFFPATLTETGLRLPIGQVSLDGTLRSVLARNAGITNLIVGVRPEHFEDATLIDAKERSRYLTLGVTADLVESLGADKYVYFSTGGVGVRSTQLAELATEAGDGSGFGENRFVARVSAESSARTGEPVELALDTTRLNVFDADTGLSALAQ